MGSTETGARGFCRIDARPDRSATAGMAACGTNAWRQVPEVLVADAYPGLWMRFLYLCCIEKIDCMKEQRAIFIALLGMASLLVGLTYAQAAQATTISGLVPALPAIDAGQSVAFTNVSTCGSAPCTYSYSADAAAGMAASGNTLTFANAGTWTVSETITDSTGQNAVATAQLQVNPDVSGSFSASPTLIYAGSNSVLSANPTGGTSPYTCSWSYWRAANTVQNSFGNTSCTVLFEGNASTLARPDWIEVVIADSVGSSFTIGANHGTSGAPSIPVLATALSLSVSASPNTVAVGSAVSISNSSQTALYGYIGGVPPYAFSYSASPSNGVQEDGNSFTFAYAGNYVVTGHVTDSQGGTASNSVTIVVTQAAPLAAPIPVPSANQPVDPGQQVTLTANAVGGTPPYSYQWYTDASCANPINGATSGTFLAEPTGTTTYYYLVTDSQGGSACSAGVTVTVNPALAIAGASVAPDVIDLGGQVSLSVSSVSGGTGTYTTEQWYYSAADGNSTGTAVGFSGLAGTDAPGAAGTAYYYFVASDGNSATEAVTPAFAVTVNPDPGITVSPASSAIDAGQGVAFYNVTTGGTPPYTYAYSVSPGTLGADYAISGNVITFNTANVYTVTETATDSLGAAASGGVEVTASPRLSVPVLLASAPIIEPGQGETLTLSWQGGTPPYSVAFYNVTGSRIEDTAVVSSNAVSYTFTVGSVGSVTFNGYVTDSAQPPETENSTPSSITVYQSVSFGGVCGKHYPQDRTYKYVISDENYSSLWSLTLNGSNRAYNITKITQWPVSIEQTGSNDCMVLNAPGGGNVLATCNGSNDNGAISMPARGSITEVDRGSNDRHILSMPGTGSLSLGTGEGSNNAYRISTWAVNSAILLNGSNNVLNYTGADGSVVGMGVAGNNNKLRLAGGYSAANVAGNRNALTFVDELVGSLACSGNHNGAGSVGSTILSGQC